MPLDIETQNLVLNTLNDFAARSIPLERRLELDALDSFPEELIRQLIGPDIGLHLVFIPEDFGGLGGGAFDIYRVSEAMAKIDLGIATAILAIALGTDPIRVGGTSEQQKHWMSHIAHDGLIVAYGVTEPTAGSNVAALSTRADRIVEDGKVVAYRINGTKQFITNGGVADLYTILAKAPDGPSFFVIEKATPGLEPGKPEDKHGIRASNTAQVLLDDVVVPANHLVGLVEGQGLAQAGKVFAFTRLMVASFGLGAGEAALKRALTYALERSQFGSLLCEKQGYTHKLLVPHAVRLAAVRAYIEEVARRIDAGDHDLPTEGAIAKLLATEEGNAAADAAIQALGGYGYTREFEVEKIKRDVRITTIYEGTSEILQSIIGINRWRDSIRSKGRFYLDMADEAIQLDSRTNEEVGGTVLAAAIRVLVTTIGEARSQRLTRQQFLQFQLADGMSKVESALALLRRAADAQSVEKQILRAKSRIYAREVGRFVIDRALVIISGGKATTGKQLGALANGEAFQAVYEGQLGAVADMDLVAESMRLE